jgi:hypothetical protein
MAGPYTQQVFMGSISNVSDGADAEVGIKRVYQGAEYRYIYNGGDQPALVGNGLICSGVSGYTCTLSSISEKDACVGVVRHNVISASTYGWVQMDGFANIEMGLTASAAIGQIVTLDINGAFIAVSAATLAAENGVPCAQVISGIASGASGTARLFI